MKSFSTSKRAVRQIGLIGLFLLVGFCLFPSEARGTCSDPGCTNSGLGNFCTYTPQGCMTVSSGYLRDNVVAQSNCGGGSGCPDTIPGSTNHCVWSVLSSSACEGCCGGSGSSGSYWIVGRVLDTTTGSNRFWEPRTRTCSDCDDRAHDNSNLLSVDLTTPISKARGSSWRCNDCPYFRINGSHSKVGEWVTVRLTPPQNWACANWHISYMGTSPPSDPVVPPAWACGQAGNENSVICGRGCEAYVKVLDGDWHNHFAFYIAPAGHLLGRVFYDANGDGSVNDGTYNSGIQHSSYSCGNYQTQDGISIVFTKGPGNPKYEVLVNTLNNSVRGCDPPYYSFNNVPTGTYFTQISGLPADWEITSMSGCVPGTVNLTDGTCQMDILQGEAHHHWIGVRQTGGTITGHVYEKLNCDCGVGDTSPPDPPNDWVVQCYNVDGGNPTTWTDAQKSGNQYTCCADAGCTSTLVDYGDYRVRLSSAGTGKQPLTVCGLPSPANFTLDAGTSGTGPNFDLCDLTAAWFQTGGGGDTHTNGSLTSYIPYSTCSLTPPCEPYFSTGAPSGLVSYGGDSDDVDFDVDSANRHPDWVSTSGWLANDGFSSEYNYDYFYQKLDSPVDNVLGNILDVSSPPADTVYQDGDLTITGGTVTAGNELKVLCNGTVTIEDNVLVDEGGFLAVFASNEINIDPAVTAVQGVFFADSQLTSGTLGADDAQLNLEGIFVGSDFVLERQPPMAENPTQPAEVFTYRPDLVMNSPIVIWRTPQTWQELAP